MPSAEFKFQQLVRSNRRDAVAVCADRRYFPMAYAVCLQLAESQPKQHDIFS